MLCVCVYMYTELVGSKYTSQIHTAVHRYIQQLTDCYIHVCKPMYVMCVHEH